MLLPLELGLMSILNLMMLWSLDLRRSQCEAYLTCLALFQGLIPEFIGVMLAAQQTVEKQCCPWALRKHGVLSVPSTVSASFSINASMESPLQALSLFFNINQLSFFKIFGGILKRNLFLCICFFSNHLLFCQLFIFDLLLISLYFSEPTLLNMKLFLTPL